MIVADASAIVDLLLGEDDVRHRVHTELLDVREIDAPDLLTLEVVAAVKGIRDSGRVSPSDASAAIEAYLGLPIRSHLTYPYCTRVVELSFRHSVYDAAYVAVAEALDAPLLTTDRRLGRSVRSVEVIVA